MSILTEKKPLHACCVLWRDGGSRLGPTVRRSEETDDLRVWGDGEPRRMTDITRSAPDSTLASIRSGLSVPHPYDFPLGG
jgi:hypothetical protein